MPWQIKGGKLTIGVDAVTLGNGKAVNPSDLPPGKYAKLTVRETDAGILPENIERIIEPYFPTKEPGRGTGMGLAVVSGIVKAHKGHILVMSRPQRGSTLRRNWPEPFAWCWMLPGAACSSLRSHGTSSGHPFMGHEPITCRVFDNFKQLL